MNNKKIILENSQPFTKIDDLQIIITKNGISKQAPAYERNNVVFAYASGGYVAVYADKATSVPALRWKGFIFAGEKMPVFYKGAMNLIKTAQEES